MTSSVAGTGGSAARALGSWANDQDGWVRLITRHVLARGSPLDEPTLESCYEQLLAEKGLSSREVRDIAAIEGTDSAVEDIPSVELVSLSNTRGVNRLSSDQVIDFNPNMTVVYGENASGKTGYVRVLKAISQARSAEAVLPDVYRSNGPAPASALTYLVGETEFLFEWRSDTQLPPELGLISVFDAPAAPLHVDEDLTYSYTPAELALFEYVHAAISLLRDRLSASMVVPSGNPFLSRFQRGTSPYARVETLRATTDVAELRALAAVTDEDRGSVERLRDEIRNTSVDDVGTRVTGAEREIALCEVGLAGIRALTEFEADQYSEAVSEVGRRRGEASAVRQQLFDGYRLPGVFTGEWRDFIESGDAYTTAHMCESEWEPPVVCPYCRTAAAEDASRLLAKYRTYLTSSAQIELAAAERALVELCAPVADVSLDIDSASDSLQAPWREALTAVASILDTQQGVLLSQRSWELSDEVKADLARRRSVLNTHVGASRVMLQHLGTETDEREAHLTRAKSELAELEDRLTLAELVDAIAEHVEILRRNDLARTVLGIFQSLLRGLTDAAKEATQELLNASFEDAFQRECTLLSSPRVRLDFPGRQGTQLRHKSVGSGERLGRVLSEGEQKVIALADFLAEVSMRPGTGPIVFDDPITSLDARRSEVVADRLVRLAANQQVVVFTHHRYFASRLLSAYEAPDLRASCSFYQVLAEDGSVGLVRGGQHPRSDTLGEIKRRVNETIEVARTSSGSERESAIHTGYGHIRAWIETFIQDRLLNGVVQRHRANISVTSLRDVSGSRLDAAADVLIPIYERACRRMWGHSQTEEQLQSSPTIDEIEEDWAMLRELESGARN